MSARTSSRDGRRRLRELARDLFWIRAAVEESDEWEAARAIADAEDELFDLRDRLEEREA